MGTMVVISTTAVPDRVRGALSRWMVEPKAGLYVGTMSARVREKLWTAVSDTVGEGAAVCLHTADNEQGFVVLTAGERRRQVVDFDGLQLIQFTALPDEGDNDEWTELPEGW
ncbi:type I-E CRISPR-associated endoribonuclease Cas2e [Nocardiopsis sp. NPDC101807]|uniref:type I-E CRISPR-associated endoribonuclease Cas2e n=1 Tax=Nocardiopsis sp. NPDC101807 TaxID=3364339 RepID=UPI0038260013